MQPGESSDGCAEAGAEFDRHEKRRDGARVAGSLAEGLNLLRDLLYARLHFDVERAIGRDSMLMPVSEIKAEKSAKLEIELYQVAVSADAAGQLGYLGTEDGWFSDWLARFRLGDVQAEAHAAERLAGYTSQIADQRRLAFTDVLAGTLPESRRAPLVLFRLMPLSVEVATALAFGDPHNASEARGRQETFLPAIRDCRECHGRVLENGRQCRQCGNPLWKFQWLTAAD